MGCAALNPTYKLIPGGLIGDGFSLIMDKIRSMQSRKEAMQKTFTAVIHKEENIYVAECPEIGTVSQGKTIEEATANLKEATELYLEEFPLPEVSHPWLTTFEAAVNA